MIIKKKIDNDYYLAKLVYEKVILSVIGKLPLWQYLTNRSF